MKLEVLVKFTPRPYHKQAFDYERQSWRPAAAATRLGPTRLHCASGSTGGFFAEWRSLHFAPCCSTLWSQTSERRMQCQPRFCLGITSDELPAGRIAMQTRLTWALSFSHVSSRRRRRLHEIETKPSILHQNAHSQGLAALVGRSVNSLV